VSLIINPGSGPIHSAAGTGWTNSEGVARATALGWWERMRADGIAHLELRADVEERDGRWVFGFRHTVTGVVVELETHGIDDEEAYRRDGHIFSPRVYWNGSSSTDPKVEDWAAPGFDLLKTFRRSSSTERGQGT
jgi:hypothetical protein